MYDYEEDVDEDLMCQICLQPFVNPTDTPCSHTFCQVLIQLFDKIKRGILANFMYTMLYHHVL